MTWIELKPHFHRLKRLNNTESIVRVSYRIFPPTSKSYVRLPVAIISIGSKLMKDIGHGKDNKIAVMIDSDRQDQFVLKKDKKGYTALLTPSGSAYKIQPTWILDIPEDKSTKVYDHEIVGDTILVHIPKNEG